MKTKIKPQKENINYDIENHEAFVKDRREKGKIFYSNMKRDKLINFQKFKNDDLWNDDLWDVSE